ncbi:MAG: hypothetical protein KBC42_02880 [Candidatus Pacebacteria bacterium]|nr:hypothetical protein [Candidatus Paceibacterota bacterium]MBP9780846.1 hypothetical protein [Candidatus Paceibacterota bacterium]
MDIGTNQPTGYEFSGYMKESNKPSILASLHNIINIVFIIAMVTLISASMLFAMSDSENFAIVFFIASLAVFYVHSNVVRTTKLLAKESENIYCSMLTCYLLDRMEKVVSNPGSVWSLVESFESEHPAIKIELTEKSNRLYGVFYTLFKNVIQNNFVTEHKEDKLKLLQSVNDMLLYQNLGHTTGNACIVQDIVRDIFTEFASEKHDASWIGYYKANKIMKVKVLLVTMFNNGPNKEARLEFLEKA